MGSLKNPMILSCCCLLAERGQSSAGSNHSTANAGWGELQQRVLSTEDGGRGLLFLPSFYPQPLCSRPQCPSPWPSYSAHFYPEVGCSLCCCHQSTGATLQNILCMWGDPKEETKPQQAQPYTEGAMPSSVTVAAQFALRIFGPHLM